MDKNLIIKNKLNNREKCKMCEVYYKSIIIKYNEKIRRNKIKAYFYKKIKINMFSSIFVLFLFFNHISFSKNISRNLNSNNESPIPILFL